MKHTVRIYQDICDIETFIKSLSKQSNNMIYRAGLATIVNAASDNILGSQPNITPP